MSRPIFNFTISVEEMGSIGPDSFIDDLIFLDKLELEFEIACKLREINDGSN